MASARKIRVKRILAAVGGVLLLCALAVLILAWRSMSYDIEAVPVAGEETFAVRFDDFSMEVPKSFRVEALNFALIWPEAEIVVREIWEPSPEQMLQGFAFRKTGWAEKFGELLDISEEMGFPAVMIPQITPPETPERFVMTIGLVRENVLLMFTLGLPEIPADLKAWQSALKRRARDFARSYTPLNTHAPYPGFTLEQAGSKIPARYGVVEPGPRDGYVLGLNFATFARGNSLFHLDVVTGNERYDLSGGKIRRFFLNLAATGYINGIGVKELTLDGRPGHEFLVKYPYLADTPAAIEFHWQDSADDAQGKWLTFSCKGDDAADPAARYGEWKQILQSVRFAKQ